jgi:hypothetical protein
MGGTHECSVAGFPTVIYEMSYFGTVIFVIDGYIILPYQNPTAVLRRRLYRLPLHPLSPLCFRTLPVKFP